MKNKLDLTADVEMYIQQIRELSGLMLHAEDTNLTNILTINELAENCSLKFQEMKNANT